MSRRKLLKFIGVFGFTAFLPAGAISSAFHKACDVCKEAWLSLSKFNAKRYQFRYIEPKVDLPKVFLYGDSISIAYTEYTRESLKDKACVYRLHTNGSSSDKFIQNMETFRKTMFKPHLKEGWDYNWDVIHFNVGLHDLKYLSDGKLDINGTQVSSLEVYKHNLNSMIEYLKKTYPKAKLIFATTTPVPKGANGRAAGDAKRYNQVARKVMRKHNDIQVNDLYLFTESNLKGFNVEPGNVHFNSEGARLQGIEVANVIAKTIEIKTVECPSVEEVEEKFKNYEAVHKE